MDYVPPSAQGMFVESLAVVGVIGGLPVLALQVTRCLCWLKGVITAGSRLEAGLKLAGTEGTELMAARRAEELSSDDISEGSEFTSGPPMPRPGGPRGPPPPRPVQDVQPMSHHLSNSVFTALQQQGITLRSALTVLPWGLEGYTDVTIEDDDDGDNEETFLRGLIPSAPATESGGPTTPMTTSMASGSAAAPLMTTTLATTTTASAKPKPMTKAKPRSNRKLEPLLTLLPSLCVPYHMQNLGHTWCTYAGKVLMCATAMPVRPLTPIWATRSGEKDHATIVGWLGTVPYDDLLVYLAGSLNGVKTAEEQVMQAGVHFGLSGPRYHEVITWLRDEHQAGRTVDICCLQETHWKEEMEFTTAADEEGSCIYVFAYRPSSSSDDKSGGRWISGSREYHSEMDKALPPIVLATNRRWLLSDNIHQAAKRFAPKAPRKRLQLRDATGGIQTHEAEFEQIKAYFVKLYAGPVPDQVVLSKGPLITVEEVLAALQRLQAGKAMPDKSAPAALWKHFSQEVAPILSAQFNLYLAPGATGLPQSWCISDLVLIPKPGKTMKTPGDLSPLSLLSLPAKALASVVASRLQEYAVRYLREVPQFAYVPGRTLAQALERVFADCAAVRVALQQGHNNVHAKRQGHKVASICGGCMLSLEVSKAYDCVSRQHLEAALRDAEVPGYLIELTLLIHHTACIRISHCTQETVIPTFRGLRQGCSLSPILWAILTGWMLRQMEDPGVASIMQANTTYADDQHYAWQVGSGTDLEVAYAAMKHILHLLRRFGLQISADKTVILMDIRGLHAQKALLRYVVDMPQGKCVKFIIDGEATYIKMVAGHVYLGAVIGYQRFEADTLQHRMKLAKGVYSRLGSILRHRSIPLRLRLLLWQGCPSQLQWRTTVRCHLFDSACVWHARLDDGGHTARLSPVTMVAHEQFECEVCGQCFSTQTAQRRHVYLTHLDQQQQQQRDEEVKGSLTKSAMDHSVDGMPTCKHCKHNFCTWHAFNYHISSQSCEGLRNLHNQQNAAGNVPQSDARVASDTILQLAGDCTWQQLALHPSVQAKHHHCPECNHWSSTPQYVKRHMLSQHTECRQVIESCMDAIKASKLSLTNPCQYCRLEFKRKDAHLRSCIGIFHGVYLHRRLARGQKLVLEGTGNVGLSALVANGGHRDEEPGRAHHGDGRAGPPTDPGPTGAERQPIHDGVPGIHLQQRPVGGEAAKVAKARTKRPTGRTAKGQGQRAEVRTISQLLQHLSSDTKFSRTYAGSTRDSWCSSRPPRRTAWLTPLIKWGWRGIR
ncbi:unnamed protein product [Symbiodinium sp. CCMP2592]|nr:unnamed protein product [Symbiodinium sp. CCMP2592]